MADRRRFKRVRRLIPNFLKLTHYATTKLLFIKSIAHPEVKKRKIIPIVKGEAVKFAATDKTFENLRDGKKDEKILC